MISSVWSCIKFSEEARSVYNFVIFSTSYILEDTDCYTWYSWESLLNVCYGRLLNWDNCVYKVDIVSNKNVFYFSILRLLISNYLFYLKCFGHLGHLKSFRLLIYETCIVLYASFSSLSVRIRLDDF